LYTIFKVSFTFFLIVLFLLLWKYGHLLFALLRHREKLYHYRLELFTSSPFWFPHSFLLLENLDTLSPHFPILLQERERFFPFIQPLLQNLPQLKPHLGELLAERELLFPILPKLMAHLSLLSPHIKILLLH